MHCQHATCLFGCVDGWNGCIQSRIFRCLGMADEDIAAFTTDPAATPVHVVGMDMCGEMWPFFRPNFANLESYLEKHNLTRTYSHVTGEGERCRERPESGGRVLHVSLLSAS